MGLQKVFSEGFWDRNQLIFRVSTHRFQFLGWGKTSGANESISGEQRHLPTDMMLDIPCEI